MSNQSKRLAKQRKRAAARQRKTNEKNALIYEMNKAMNVKIIPLAEAFARKIIDSNISFKDGRAVKAYRDLVSCTKHLSDDEAYLFDTDLTFIVSAINMLASDFSDKDECHQIITDAALMLRDQ